MEEGAVYYGETPKIKRKISESEEEEEIVPEFEEIERYGRKHFGEIASPYIAPYFHNSRFLDSVFGIRREDDSFMIGDLPISVDDESNVVIRGETFRGTKGLWELLTKKRVNESLITKADLNTYKRILILTNGHLENNEPSSNIKTTRGAKYNEVISKLFPRYHRWLKYRI